MSYIFIGIVIWAIAAVIYGKVKGIGFLKSFVAIPLRLIAFFFNEVANGSTLRDVKKEAQRQGRDDVLEKVEITKGVCNVASSQAENAANKVENK